MQPPSPSVGSVPLLLHQRVRFHRVSWGLVALSLLATYFVVAYVVPATPTPASADHILYRAGDIFAGVGNGKINHYDPSGNLLEILNTGSTSTEDTGMCFDRLGNLYATVFEVQRFAKFDNKGGLLTSLWGAHSIVTQKAAW